MIEGPGRYASWYSRANLYNCAVAGAACFNDITPRWDDDTVGLFPDYQGYETPDFLADKAVTNADGTQLFTGESESTVYSLWIGTNDLGNKAFLTDSEISGKSIPDDIDCNYSVFDNLYVSGARNMILMNIVPLNYAPQYALLQDGGVVSDKYLTDKAMWNATALSGRMWDQADLANGTFEYRTPVEVKIENRDPDANFVGMVYLRNVVLV